MEKCYCIYSIKDLEKYYTTPKGNLYVEYPKRDTVYVVEGYSLDECKMAFYNGAHFWFITGPALDEMKEYDMSKYVEMVY